MERIHCRRGLSAHGPACMQATESKRQHSATGPPAAARAFAGHDSAGRVGLVSVIIPAYNEVATVERTISSVRNQTYSDLEVLVVDDGSTDETAAIVQRLADIDHRITLLRKPNGGLASARNYGIAHAGPWGSGWAGLLLVAGDR